MHVVVFPGWYPNRTDKLTGDFIQRHMQAIALKCKVTVVIPIKDKAIKKVERFVFSSGNLTEIYYYYPSVSSINFIDHFISFVRYNYLCFRDTLGINRKEKLDLVHLYVLQKNLLLGFFIRALLKVPFVISEQSTFYVDGGLEKMNLHKRKIYKWVFESSNSVHTVSKFLFKNISSKLRLTRKGIVIPNVVNTDLFCFINKPSRTITEFVHVSNMVYQKNVEGMLEAFSSIKNISGRFVLNLVGPMPQHIQSLIEQLGLVNNVKIWNERTNKEVAEIMRQSDVLVFFTRFETFGCVIIEANACGLPVILTDLEVTRELISENENGLFVQNENVKDLEDKILDVMADRGRFNPASIARSTHDKFNFEKIGQEFLNWYNRVISNTK